MYKIWANLGVLILFAIMGGFAWFVLYVIGKAVFEDFFGGLIKKARRKKEEEEDYYIY
jgi:hypothetical protein